MFSRATGRWKRASPGMDFNTYPCARGIASLRRCGALPVFVVLKVCHSDEMEG